jgi:D-xylulose reductase
MCLGHEAAGIIVQLGGNIAAQVEAADRAKVEVARSDKAVPGKSLPKKVLRLGDRVALEPGVTCRMCDDCRGGQYQVSAGDREGGGRRAAASASER